MNRFRTPGPPAPLDILTPPGGGGGARYPSAPPLGAMSSGAALAPAAARTRMVLPPDWFPSPEATYFSLSGRQSVAGPTAAPVVLAAFTVPANSVGAVRDLNIATIPMVPTDDITWRVLVDGAPVPGWSIPLAPRPAASVVASFLPESTRIFVPAGSTISIDVSRTDANTSLLVADARGWFYPQSAHESFYGVR